MLTKVQSLVLQFKQSYKTQLKKRREEHLPTKVSEPPVPSVVASSSSVPTAASAAPLPPATVAPQPAAPPEREKPKKNLIKLSRAGTISKTSGGSPASMSTPPPSKASPAPASTPSAVPAPVVTPVSRQPLVSAAPARPASLDQGDTISVQSRPAGNSTPVPTPKNSTPTPEPSRPLVNAKATKISNKKRKLHDLENQASSPRPPKRKIITWRYKEKVSPGKSEKIARILSSMKKSGSAATSSISRGSPNVNVDASFTSTLGVGPSSQQKTPLPNGKIRKPLPSSGKPGSSMSPPARPLAGPRSLSQQSSNTLSSQQPRTDSPGIKRPSTESSPRPCKIIKLKTTSRAVAELAEAAARPGSQHKGSNMPSSNSKPSEKHRT